MAKENSKDPAILQPQQIPLSKIHDLPGVFVGRQPDKSYGGLVTSIQAGGVKEPVVLRLREDGEYQLVTGYRRLRASELAKKQDIPALVYEMSIQEAQDYHHRVKNKPDMGIPGKLVPAPDQGQKADLKGPENPTPAAPADQDMEQTTIPMTSEKGPAPVADGKDKGKDKPPADAAQDKEKAPDPKAPEKTPVPAADDKAKGKDKSSADVAQDKEKAPDPATPEKGPAPAADDKNKGKEKNKAAKEPSDDFSDIDPAAVRADLAEHGIVDGKVVDTDKLDAAPIVQQAKEDVKKGQAPVPAADDKSEDKQDPIPTVAELEAKVKAGETISLTELAAAEKAERQAKRDKKTPPASAGKDKPDTPQPAPVVVTSAAKGPAGTMISQVLPERLSPPDEAAKKDFPSPKEGESIFVTLHPAYLVKSEYNTISVDPKSEDYQELKKSIELNGVKDPVLARIGDAGTLEIVSGQRRHMIATELNYPVPTIIQKISDPDVKILVADGNLHRPKISTHDLARSLRMKMEGMKQKSGRRKKGSFKAEELDSDVKLAQEMGMPVSKLNRLIRLSEATKDVCDRVDDGSLTLSVASALSFLKPKNQDNVLHLMDLGYKVPAERVEYMKKVEKAGKLDEESMRAVLDGKNVLDPPKQEAPQAPQPEPSAPAASTIPPSPDVPQPEGAPAVPPQPVEGQDGPAPAAPPAPAPTEGQPQESKDPFEGKQERPEHTKVVLAGDRLRKYFPDVMMTPREIEESIYDALEERRQRQQKEKEKLTIFPKRGPKR